MGSGKLRICRGVVDEFDGVTGFRLPVRSDLSGDLTNKFSEGIAVEFGEIDGWIEGLGLQELSELHGDGRVAAPTDDPLQAAPSGEPTIDGAVFFGGGRGDGGVREDGERNDPVDGE